MRHGVDGRRFGRNSSHRAAMFRNMANSVILQEQVVTTVQKAKETRRVVDRLITLGKSAAAASRRLAFDRTRDERVVGKLFSELKDRYAKRAGGYTRVVKLSGLRRGDSAEMAILELVDHPPIDRKRKVKATKGEEAATDAASVDPFKKYRKAFGKSAPAAAPKKPAKKAASASSAEGASKATATKKKKAAKKKTSK